MEARAITENKDLMQKYADIKTLEAKLNLLRARSDEDPSNNSIKFDISQTEYQISTLR